MTRFKLRLYLAGDSPDSMEALARIKALCDAELRERCELTIVDILEEPGRALEDGILVTPTLIKDAPPPSKRLIVGNLSKKDKVLAALGAATSKVAD